MTRERAIELLENFFLAYNLASESVDAGEFVQDENGYFQLRYIESHEELQHHVAAIEFAVSVLKGLEEEK